MAQDLSPSRPTSVLQSAAVNAQRLLKTDSLASRLNDAQNVSTNYIIRKLQSRRLSLVRRRHIISVMCEKGMPAVLMISPIKEFQAWLIVKMMDDAKLREFQTSVTKGSESWNFKLSPKDVRKKLASASKFYSLLYVDSVSTGPPEMLRINFVSTADGKARKPLELELRPEPYSKDEAIAQCTELRELIQCGLLNAFLQKPVMLDRPMRPMDIALWCERVKPFVNSRNAYNKTNLHHQIQLQATGQEDKVTSLLNWKADPNVIYGPTQMTPLHMAASWNAPSIVIALLKAQADATRLDVNGLAPLHCAAIYGDLMSLKALVELGKVDVNQRIGTVRGEMSPLDCVLECEESEDTVLDMWKFLCEAGADPHLEQDYILYPPPYPSLKGGRLVGLLAVATRNRWQTRVDEDKKLRTTYDLGVEDESDLKKLSVMLRAGMNPDERDTFGRTGLMLSSSAASTELLIKHGANPNGIASLQDVRAYAEEYVKIHYLGTIADKTDELRQVKYQELELEEKAERMGVIIATARLELIQAYRRAMCSMCPLLEALAEGKLGKIEALLAAGAEEVVYLPAHTGNPVNFNTVLFPESPQYAKFQQAFGKYIWNELALKLLDFSGLVFKYSSHTGSQFLQSQYAKDRVFKGLNLPQHKACEARYATLIQDLHKAEERKYGKVEMRPPVEYPEPSSIAECKKLAFGILRGLEANPAARLLEEAVISSRPGAKIHVSTEVPVNEVGTRRPSSRVGSEYFETLKIGVEAGETSTEDEGAAEVSRLSAAMRRKHGTSAASIISQEEGWGAYKRRTLSLNVDDLFDEEDLDFE
eukprot:m.16658 g.16658  ORF g.16658 m.16658 type:complete len:817 (+) comp5762_c0_seq2:461-2911(+)